MTDPTPQDRGSLPSNRPAKALVQMDRTVAGVLGLCIISLGGWWAIQGGGGNGSNSDSSTRIQTGIDPNTATWVELAQLPGLGETAGRAIVAYREDRLRAGSRPVFRDASDLEPVPGIGPSTIARIGPHLRFDSIE